MFTFESLLEMAASFAYGSCTAPPSLRARAQSHPAAENGSNVGTWFGDRKHFVCAADAFASAAKIQPDSASLNYMGGLSN